MTTPATFKINLPSIPGKAIRLRIQDIAQKGFLVREQRFASDKSQLAQQFTETFENLHEPPPAPTFEEHEKESRSTVASYRTEVTPVRYVMPEYKNVLMEVLKRQQIELLRSQGLYKQPPKKAARAISQIVKSSQLQQPYISVEERLWAYRRKEKQRKEFVQDYFNMGKKLEDEQRERLKKLRMQPSASFLSESRGRIQQRAQRNDGSLGPGYYPAEPERDQEEEQRKQQIKRLASVRPRQPKPPAADDAANLKKHTAMIFAKHQIEVEKRKQQEPEQQRQQRPPHEDHMFVRDDRDRFGDQIFPIVLKLHVPGPGAYDVPDTIEEKAHKISTLQEQRQLLKEWFNQ